MYVGLTEPPQPPRGKGKGFYSPRRLDGAVGALPGGPCSDEGEVPSPRAALGGAPFGAAADERHRDMRRALSAAEHHAEAQKAGQSRARGLLAFGKSLLRMPSFGSGGTQPQQQQQQRAASAERGGDAAAADVDERTRRLALADDNDRLRGEVAALRRRVAAAGGDAELTPRLHPHTRLAGLADTRTSPPRLQPEPRRAVSNDRSNDSGNDRSDASDSGSDAHAAAAVLRARLRERDGEVAWLRRRLAAAVQERRPSPEKEHARAAGGDAALREALRAERLAHAETTSMADQMAAHIEHLAAALRAARRQLRMDLGTGHHATPDAAGNALRGGPYPGLLLGSDDDANPPAFPRVFGGASREASESPGRGREPAIVVPSATAAARARRRYELQQRHERQRREEAAAGPGRGTREERVSVEGDDPSLAPSQMAEGFWTGGGNPVRYDGRIAYDAERAFGVAAAVDLRHVPPPAPRDDVNCHTYRYYLPHDRDGPMELPPL